MFVLRRRIRERDLRAFGNFESTTDFNGVETRYEHDTARTLETSRTEAYGTANERTIETEWHSTFRLPLEIHEPGRDLEFTYDSNGNVLTQTVTDTATSESRTRDRVAVRAAGVRRARRPIVIGVPSRCIPNV